MKHYIEERAVEIAYYIIEHKATVRQTAKEFGVSKSTIHKDCTDRLEQINPTLAQSVRKVLDVNKQERHIRGGLAMVTILACMIFAALSGSGPATTAAIGSIMIPGMIGAGYRKDDAAAVSATAGRSAS